MQLLLDVVQFIVESEISNEPFCEMYILSVFITELSSLHEEPLFTLISPERVSSSLSI